MRPIDADEILCDGFREWLGCVLCGRATKEHPSCDGACDMQARIYADKAADALAIWLADMPTIEAEPVRHGRWKETSHKNFFLCSECDYAPWLDDEFPNKTPYYCPKCGAKMMDEVSE